MCRLLQILQRHSALNYIRAFQISFMIRHKTQHDISRIGPLKLRKIYILQTNVLALLRAFPPNFHWYEITEQTGSACNSFVFGRFPFRISESSMAITIKFVQENSGVLAGLRSDRFLPNPFYFIILWSSYNSQLYATVCNRDTVVKSKSVPKPEHVISVSESESSQGVYTLPQEGHGETLGAFLLVLQRSRSTGHLPIRALLLC